MSEATMNLDLSNTPDTLPPVMPGIRRLTIVNPPTMDVMKYGDNTGKPCVVVQLTITDPSQEDKGRSIFDRLCITDERDRVKLRRLGKSAGIGIAPLKPEELTGKVIMAEVKNTTKVDKGISTTYANIREYIIPGDPNYPTA